MKSFERFLILLIFICIAGTLCSCDGSESVDNSRLDENTKQGSDITMALITEQELLQYIEDNLDVGLTEKDFEDISINDFIKDLEFTSEDFGRYPLKLLVETYKENKYYEQRAAIMAKEIRSVDSTDEEYRAFIEAYLEDVGKESLFLGGNPDGSYTYHIFTENGKYGITIGRTKNMDQFDIREGRFYGNYEIYAHHGDMVTTTTYCYSDDNKFYLIASGNDDFSYELYEIFTKVTLPK